MNFKYPLFLLAICMVKVSFCETEVNGTANSRREILEQQAADAYQNACLRLQELSNWMSVVFKIKSVWVGSAVNELAASSEGILSESDRRNLPRLPPRPKIKGNECSIKSMQVTAQTYVYLQSQMLLLKMIFGRKVVNASRTTLTGASTSLQGRMQMIDVFNSTLNNILSTLKQSTETLSIQANNEWNPKYLVQGSRIFQYIQDPRNLYRRIQEVRGVNRSEMPQTESKSFFQNLGKTLDSFIFPTAHKNSAVDPNSAIDRSPFDDQNLTAVNDKND